MSRELLIQAMYALAPQMTNENGFKFDEWATCESWDNGSMINCNAPQFYIEFGEETNSNENNFLGNNEFMCELPVTVKFGATMSTPNDSLKTVSEQIEIHKSKMMHDIKRAFGTPYKIDIPNFYCGTKYDGEIDSAEDNENNDPYTSIAWLGFTVTYTEGMGIGEW